MNTLVKAADFILSCVLLLAMTVLWLPLYNPALSLSLVLLLLKIEPCVMFQQQSYANIPSLHSRKLVPKISPLMAKGVNGDSSSSSSKFQKENMDDMSKEAKDKNSPTERRRKLVDRTHVYYKDGFEPTDEVTKTSTAQQQQQQQLGDAPTVTPTLFEEDELCYLDDLPGTNAGQTCFVSDSSSLSDDPKASASLPFNTRIPDESIDFSLRYLPFIMPLGAYMTYVPTARLFEQIVQALSNNNWVAVDGGQYQAEIITPAINGLVVPSIALLFATMTSTTINTLRQRQFQILTSLNTEANDMRMLATHVDSLPEELREVKNHLREYLIQYASR